MFPSFFSKKNEVKARFAISDTENEGKRQKNLTRFRAEAREVIAGTCRVDNKDASFCP